VVKWRMPVFLYDYCYAAIVMPSYGLTHSGYSELAVVLLRRCLDEIMSRAYD